MGATAEQWIPTYFGYEVTEWRQYTIGVEKMLHVMDEVNRLVLEHWDETERIYMDGPANPMYHGFAAMEDQGRFMGITVRLTGTNEMVGYLGFAIAPHPNQQNRLRASEIGFFLTEEHRQGRIAIRLLSYAEKTLRRLGIKYMVMSDKSPSGGADLGRLLGRHGFLPISRSYSKDLGE